MLVYHKTRIMFQAGLNSYNGMLCMSASASEVIEDYKVAYVGQEVKRGMSEQEC